MLLASLKKSIDSAENAEAILPKLDEVILLRTQEATLISGVVTDNLLSRELTFPKGKTSPCISVFADNVRDYYRKNLADEVKKMLGGEPPNEKSFESYLRHAAIRVYPDICVFIQNMNLRQLYESLIIEATAGYALLNDLKLPPGIIKTYGHMHSLEKMQRIQEEAKKLSDTGSHYPVKTLINMVYTNVYPSVPVAKEAYDRILAETKQVFGEDPRSRETIRTAALLVFTKKYATVAHAKLAYIAALKKAKKYFGKGKLASQFITTAAGLVFSKKYPTMRRARLAFFKIHSEFNETFPTNPASDKSTRALLEAVFSKKLPSVQKAWEIYAARKKIRATA